MTLLTQIQRVCKNPGVGIAVPTVVVGSGDAGIVELLELANQEGEELSKRSEWPVLTTEKTFATTAAETQVGAIPTDFDRFIDGSWWNRSTSRKLRGPLTSQQWQQQKALPSTGIINAAFRIRGTSMLITPVPTAGQTVAYEYVTKNWCATSLAVGQTAWAADTDVGVLDERLMALGIVWRWRKAKGLNYADAFNTYEQEVQNAFSSSGGRPTLSLSNRQTFPVGPNIPEGSWSL